MIPIKHLAATASLVTLFLTTASGQSAVDSLHNAAGVAWGGTWGLCNVCHEPYTAQYAIRQMPYWNHQVNAPTFRGNKLDGAPVMIRQGADNCVNCHTPAHTENLYRFPSKDDAIRKWVK
jgi:cytochrome c553